MFYLLFFIFYLFFITFFLISIDISLLYLYYTSVLRKKAQQKKSCTGAKLLKENEMKKSFIATLLIMIIASISIFAATDSFTVTTDVTEIGNVMVATASTVPTDKDFTGLTEFTTLPITTSGDQGTVAYMATISNKRSGYEVTMSATAMASAVSGQATSYIDYTVSCGDQSITTNGAAASTVTGTTVDKETSLTGLTGKSLPIDLSVDKPTFDAAVSGSYTGTVTFTFSAT